MSALRVIGSGIGCATFAAAGAFIGSELADMHSGDPLRGASHDSVVLGAIVGSAVGALLIGALSGAGCEKPMDARRLDLRFP